MGILRFLLAFAVFNGHANLPLGFSIVAGSTAVHCFFVISGFYMAMVLNEKYIPAGASYADFISSRLLRLAPAYLVVVVLTVFAAVWMARNGSVVLPPLEATRLLIQSSDGYPVLFANALSQLSLVGQDLFYFAGWTRESGLHFVADFQTEPHPLNRLLLVPPAWSLSVELYFYLLAPYLVRRSVPLLIALIACSLLCRVLLAVCLGWQGDPWSYRFFPSELAFFLTGVLAYRVQGGTAPTSRLWLVALALFGGMLGLAEMLGIWQADLPVHRWARVGLFAALAAFVPMLFRWTKNWRWDRYVGELSYPLYVCHFLAIWVLMAWGDIASGTGRVVVVVGTVLFAIALQQCVDAPVDRYRQARMARRGSRSHRLAKGNPVLSLVQGSARSE
jgi:peptidoglycan/LPS O-acetylase OafA/YrhL